MSEWRECELGVIATFSYGTMPKKENLGKGQYPTFSGYKYQYQYPEYNCEKGDLIVVARGVGGTGDVKIVKEKCYLTNLSIKINLDKSKLDNQFFYYNYAIETLRYLDSGSAQSQITINDLSKILIVIPSLPEQKAIAAVLSSLDDKIDLLHRQNKTLEAMAETLFKQWFVVEAREDWDEKPLGYFFEISSGKGIKREQLVENGIYPVLGANGEIGRINDFLCDEKLLFTGRVGTLGNIFIIDNAKVWLSDNTLIFRNIKYFYFIYFILKLARLVDYNVGSTQPLIRQSDIKEIPIIIPNDEKLNIFEMQSELLFKKIKTNQKQIQTLETLRDNLLPKLMSGEVRVKW